MTVSPAGRNVLPIPRDGRILDALDLPADLYVIQNTFWKARSEFEALEAAYLLVVKDVLARREPSA